MRLRAIFAIAMAVVLGVGAYALTAHYARDASGPRRILQTQSLAVKLQLTDEQRDAIDAINAAFQRERQQMRDRHRQHRSELLELLRENPPDRERIDDKVEEISQLQQQMQRLAVSHIIDVSAELDDNQRERLFTLIDEAMCPGSVMGGGGRDCR